MVKKLTLKRELTRLMMLASVCTLLSACIAVFYVFFSFFFEKTKQDISYVLNSTSQQYQSYMQFIEDGVIAVRHNTLLDDFFEHPTYQEDVVVPQLSYSIDLYSDRNMVDYELPFVTGVYLFNRRNQCIYERYYASTLAAEVENEEKIKNMQQWFQKDTSRYTCVTDQENIHLLFRIYDDDMEEKGIGIAQISKAAVEKILENVTVYDRSTWMIVSDHDVRLMSYGKKENVAGLETAGYMWTGLRKLENRKVIGCAVICGFGVKLVVAVGQENIFSILRPTMLAFLMGLILVFLITFLIAYGTSYRFTKPVTKMIATIHAFGEQKFDARIEDSAIQEFHDIGIVFNEMADKIRYLITDVYEKQLLITKSQVKYLQSQIHPHFQFNILAMLSLKAKMDGCEEVYEGLHAFSKLMQGKIFREREIKIKVKEELEIVRFYLYLQKSRYQEKLSYEVVLEDESINEDLIPRLLIEPLVENAVSHGIEPKRENGRIMIRLYEQNDSLHICIEDNGVGVHDDAYDAIKNDMENEIGHTHTGLENTRRLLEILYGSRHQFLFWSEKDVGTKIEIVLPAEHGENNVECNSSR